MTWFRVGLALLVSGCGLNFPDEYRVEDLRILNIRAEPPEVPIFVPGDAEDFDPANPPPLADIPVRLEVLAAHPDLGAELRFNWYTCPRLSRIPCDGPTRLPGVGSATVAEFSPAAQLLDELLGGDPREFAALLDPRDLFNGLYAFVQAQAQVSAAAIRVDTNALDGTKRVILFEPRLITYAVREARALGVPDVEGLPSLCTDATSQELGAILEFLRSREPNRSPEFSSVVMRRLEGTDTATRTVGAGPIELARGQRIDFEGRHPVTSREPYVVIDANCQLQQFEEIISYAWFTAHGELSRHLTRESSPRLRYTAPDRAGPDRIWVVQRDGRGGSQHRVIDLRVR